MSPGKDNCLVLDFGQNAARFGPIDQITGKRKAASAGGDAPVKECPECESILATAVRVCPDCGFEFPPPETIIDSTASTAPMLSSQIVPEWVEVSKVAYAKHEKAGKPPSLRVEYLCGLMRHREWIGIESRSDFARKRAWSWWANRSGDNLPINVDSALRESGKLSVPKFIQVKPAGKYFEIVGYQF